MKKISLALIFMAFLTWNAFAQQVPGKFNYQAAVRNATGTALTNATVALQISIADGSPNGTVQFSEQHVVTTSNLGLVNLQVGAGTLLSGNFDNITWGTGTKWLIIDIDPNAGTNFQPLGASELVSVPYALYARSSGGGTLDQLSDVNTTGVQVGQVLQWNGSAWVGGNASGWTDGTALTTATNSKKVGIGTSTPQQKVHIHDQDNSFTWLQISSGANGSGASDGAFIGQIANDLKIENCEVGKITLGTCVQPDQVVIQNNGNVELAGQLKIAGGTPGQGKVLTSDSNGLASWQNAVGATYTAGDGISIDSGTISTPWKVVNDGFSNILQAKYPVQTSGLLIKQYNNWGATLNLFGLAGTSEDPAPVGFNSTLGNIYFAGSVGSGYEYNGGAGIRCTTADDWTAPDSKRTANLSFFTADAGFYRQRMLINGNGQVSINSGNISNLNAINTRFHVSHPTNERGISIRNDDTGNYWSHSTGAGGGDLVLSFNGAIRGIFSSTSGVYSQGSDRSLKTDIQPWANPMLPALMKLRPATYRYKDNTPESPRSLGFIAQEVKEVFPEAVTSTTDPTSGKEILAVAYDRFGILAVKAIQEQQATIEAQQAEINALKAALAKQEAEILARLERLEASLGEK